MADRLIFGPLPRGSSPAAERAREKRIASRGPVTREEALALLSGPRWAPQIEELNDWRERLFVLLVVRGRAPAGAFTLAFKSGQPIGLGSTGSAEEKSIRLLARAAIQDAIYATEKRLAKLTTLGLEDIVERLAAIADGHMGRLVTLAEDGSVAFDLRALAESDWRTIKALAIDYDRDGRQRIKVELHDAVKAMDTLGRHLGMGQGTVRIVAEERESRRKIAALMAELPDDELADLERIGRHIEDIATRTIDVEASEAAAEGGGDGEATEAAEAEAEGDGDVEATEVDARAVDEATEVEE